LGAEILSTQRRAFLLAFLQLLKAQLNSVGTRLTIDVYNGNPMLWDYTLLQPGVDRVMDMSTYNGFAYDEWLVFYRDIVKESMPLEKVGIGLGCWIDDQTKGTWAVTPKSAQQRIEIMLQDNVTQVGMFRLLPAQNWPEPFWWTYLEQYASGSS